MISPRVRHSGKNYGQMEVMGLVVIVILITLGMLFMAIFAFNDSSQKKVFTRKGLASSTVSALLKTTVSTAAGCTSGYAGRRDLPQFGEDILEDCALFYEEYAFGPSVDPQGYSLYTCGGVHSCQFFLDSTAELLDQTLGAWGKHYVFTSKLITGVPPPIPLMEIKDAAGKGCPGEADASGLFPIQAGDAGLVESQLLVCD